MIEPTGSHFTDTNVMFYSHDTYGLGHLRRTLTLAGRLRADDPGSSQLIVTGSPVAHSFPYPAGSDYIKLPSVVKTGPGQYEARSIDTDFTAIRDMRRDIILSAARHFPADVLIVDHAPAGLKGEIVPTLRYLKEHAPGTRLVLGLRDVVDEAPRVRQSWAREGVYDLLNDVYDLILVYGHQEFYDVVEEYGLPPHVAAKTRFVGYLGREPGARSAAQIRASLPLQTDQLVVVTGGGGGDGRELFQTVLESLRARPDPIRFDCLLIGGPLMGEADRATLHDLAGAGASLHFLDFAEDMTSYLGAADAVISMGGYNSVCEILSLGRPSIIVPRVWPRQEQLIRAEALSRRGHLRMIHPNDLTPPRLLSDLEDLLAQPANALPRLPMTGLPGVSAALDSLRLSTANPFIHDMEPLARVAD